MFMNTSTVQLTYIYTMLMNTSTVQGLHSFVYVILQS